MSDDPNDPLKERLEALKKAKPAGPPAKEDPAERDQLVILASRIEAQAQALLEERKRGAAASREQAERWTDSLKAQTKLLIQAVRGDLHAAQTQHEKALQQWAARLEELAAFNRMLGTGLFFMVALFFGLLAWEMLR